ncbi:hypothetical protein [Sphingomonas panacis]|uniref:hypothetical protein n=1 Tax=Sphingomonas panacis TaxID=1560345 RepID=UPI001471FB83|nr:hypothetical protein [Sphingomonas panacis]
MFDEIDRRYFERRAQESRERAQTAQASSIAEVHRNFAEEYERKAAALSAESRSA